MDSHKIFQAELPDVERLVDWAAAEGWNPGPHDAACFFNTDPGGFFVARDMSGALIGGISAVAYDAAFGFVGFFIVSPEYRGHRVGLSLGYHALNYLNDRAAGLDGVLAKVPNYESYGFKLAHHNIRFQGMSRGGVAPGGGLLGIGEVPFDDLAAFDRKYFPALRRRFLELWINAPERAGFAVMDDDGGLKGYGVIRRCRVGYRIGPLFADDPATAELLLDGMLASVGPGEMFFLDVPSVNAAAMDLAARRGMSPVFRTARMYDKPVVLPVGGIYGVTSFELG